MRLSVPQLMPLIILRPMLPISRAFPSLNLETGRQWLTVVDSFRQGRQCDCVESGRQFSTVVDSGRQWLTEGSFRQLRQWSTVVDSSTVRSTVSTVSTARAQEVVRVSSEPPRREESKNELPVSEVSIYIYICSRAADGWRAATVEAADT